MLTSILYIVVILLDYLVKLNRKNTIYYFIVLLTISVTINNVISYLLFNIADVIYHLNLFPIYFAKYTLISIIINLVLALILSIIIKNINLNLEVKKIENHKKNTKVKNK